MMNTVKKITAHLTDAQFKADLDECNNFLGEHAARLLAFQRQVDRELADLDTEDFHQEYIRERTATLSSLLANVADIGRTMLDRLTARACLLAVREELRHEQERKNKKR